MTAPRGLATDPTGRLLVSDTVSNRIEAFPAGNDAWWGQWTAAGGRSGSFNVPAGIAVDPRGSVYVADPGNARVVTCGATARTSRELGGPVDLGRVPDERSGLGVGGERAAGDLRGRHRTTTASSSTTRAARWWRGGAPARATAQAGSGAGPVQAPRGARGDARRVTCTWRTPATTASWSYLRPGACWRNGAPGLAATATSTRPRASRSTRAGNVYVVDSANNRVEVFGPTGQFLAKWGLRGIAPGRVLPAERDRGGLQRQRVRGRHQQQPRGALRNGLARGRWLPGAGSRGHPRSTWRRCWTCACCAATGCSRGARSRWASAASERARSSSAPRSSAQRPAAAVALIAAARALPAAAMGHVRVRVGARRAAPPSARARAADAALRARVHDPRDGAHRQARQR